MATKTKFNPRKMMEKAIEVMRLSVAEKRTDKMSGLADWPEPRTGIPTIIPTKCRDSRSARHAGSEFRQTSYHFGGISKADAAQQVNPARYPAILAGFAASLSGHFPGHFVRLQQRHAT